MRASVWGTIKGGNITVIECGHDSTHRAGHWIGSEPTVDVGSLGFSCFAVITSGLNG